MGVFLVCLCVKQCLLWNQSVAKGELVLRSAPFCYVVCMVAAGMSTNLRVTSVSQNVSTW